MRARDILEAEVGKAKAVINRLRKANVFTWDDINPDAFISPDEITPILDFIKLNGRERVVSMWFPNEKLHLSNAAVDDIELYLQHKKMAMQRRLQGRIGDAQGHEQVCDILYDKLPGFAKW